MSDVKDVKVDVIIPAYNEQFRIMPTIQKLKKHKMVNAIYVVDDGSTDKTRIVAEQEGAIVLNYGKNMGKGFASRFGLECAISVPTVAQYFMIYDADGSSQLNFLDYLQWIKPVDLVITSRERTGSRIMNDKFTRKITSKVFNTLVHYHLGLRSYGDTQNGAVIFRKKFAEKFVKLGKINGFCFTLEYLKLAEKHKVKVIELPVTWIDTKDSRVKVVRDSIRMYKEILQVKRRFEE